MSPTTRAMRARAHALMRDIYFNGKSILSIICMIMAHINMLIIHAIILMCLLLPKQSNRIIISELMYLINKSLGREIIGRT